ncbi:CDP-diacylglycerol--glycerol-3-phosphate 3-phosphatidyltransferase [Candidatus Saccharibacteria bacterium]|nr:CDP-diacylglycerol--glycerol-3-phosphate 3-phosphatidyltransferase [Candidatus Saccharibacteria bacterium]
MKKSGTRAGDGSGGDPAERQARWGGTVPAGPARLTGPTILTMLRMLLSVAFVAFALLPDMWAKITALVIFILASVTDLIDGKWARKANLVTDLGAFLDPIADKMLVDLAFLVLVYQDIVPLWVFAIILVRDFAVDGMRMASARSGKTISASIYGKWKALFQMATLIIILFAHIIGSDVLITIGNIVLYISLILTIISGLDYLYQGYKSLHKHRNNK